MRETRTGDPMRSVALAHGACNIIGGLWPLLHSRSFEWVFGSKTDRWLQRTTAGLLVSAGLTQMTAARDPQGLAHARRTGLGTAGTLLAIDLVYVPKGTIRWTYLLDAAMEAGWIVAWARCPTTADPAGPR
ncbi:hypothetical protein [Streptomyces flaveolus]|uniref:hypothetical protein n=1 Tax=Streptomyces flaveolus TaxID=67297 RepID=UPI0016717EA1|nr:hypothetical protein [Streptomyces flaveolus]GGQ93489.1 hypothetical protein GCM10010216_64900 [Streptomyces flaveolus]